MQFKDSDIDAYIESNNLNNASFTDISNLYLTNDGKNASVLTTAADSILEDPSFDSLNLTSAKDKIEFIASRPELLKNFVRKMGNLSNRNNMKFIDHVMTDDEAKVITKNYKSYLDKSTTFTIKGTSVGFIQDVVGKHNKVKGNDQLLNYVYDENVLNAFRETILPGVKGKINSIFRMSRGDVAKSISDLANAMRKEGNEDILL